MEKSKQLFKHVMCWGLWGLLLLALLWGIAVMFVLGVMKYG